MDRRRRVNPVLLFPAELLVEAEVLGESFAVDIEGVELDIRFPARNEADDWPSLVAPVGKDQGGHDQLVSSASGNRWGSRYNDSWMVWAAAASLLATVTGNPRDAPEVKALGESFDAWFLRAREWILVRHDIPRAGLHSSRGTVVTGWDPSVGQWGTGGVFASTLVAGLRGASTAEVKAAFERATRHESPPPQHRLLLDSRTAVFEEDTRRAVIDAGTAAEAAVATAIGDRLRDVGLHNDAIDTMVIQANGLIGLVDLYESLGGDLPESRGRVMNELANPRNRAVHGGEPPTRAQAATALRCAASLVANATALAFP